MIRTKFCCNGQNAELVATLFPMMRIRNGRQLKAWTTFVEYIDTDQARALVEEKRYVATGVA